MVKDIQDKVFVQIIMLLFILSPEIFSQNMVDFELIVPQKEYYTGELIEIGLLVKKASDFSKKDQSPISLYLQLFNEHGIELDYTGPFADFYSPSLNNLRELNEDYRIIELNKFFGVLYSTVTTDKYIDPGTYILKATLKINNELKIFREAVFTIKDPVNDELTVYQKWSKLLRGVQGKGYTAQQVVKMMEEIVDLKPNSVYAPIILTNIGAFYGVLIMDKEKAFQISKLIVERYPWSSRAQGMIKNVLNKIPDKKSRIKLVEELKEKSKKSLMGKIFQKELAEQSKIN